MSKSDRLEEKCVFSGEIAGHQAYIVPSPGYFGESLNGYAVFSERPVKERGYEGILTYVPVHGGITYARMHDGLGIVYGFDTCHHGSRQFPISDQDWIKGQIELMVRGIKLAAELEDEYLLAAGDNEKRAEICQNILDLSEGEVSFNFGLAINILSGEL